MTTVSLTKEQTIPSHGRSFPPVQQDGLRLQWMVSNHNTNNDPTNSWDPYQGELSCVSSNSEYTGNDTARLFFLNSFLKNIA